MKRNIFVIAFLMATITMNARSEVMQETTTPEPMEVTLEKDLMVPMRDTVHLATDLYYAKNGQAKQPAIIIRTPYNKEEQSTVDTARYFASYGYRVLVQDVRGKWKSEGKYIISAADRKDGYDLIDWVIAQPWSTGRVGSYGCSYLGENQIMLAAEKHPAHKAMIAQAAGGAVGKAANHYGYFGAFEGGAIGLAALFGWFPYAGTKDKTDGKSMPENISQALWGLPIIDLLDEQIVGPTDWKQFVTTPLDDPWWDRLGYITDQDTFDVPTLHVNSWYDYGTSETLFFFNKFRKYALSERARNNQYVIISPGSHCSSEKGTQHTVIGEVDVGDARFPYFETYLNWYNHWLKKENNGVTNMPRVQYFLIGKGEWRQADQWPPKGITKKKYYLHSGGNANSVSGDGELKTKRPSDNQKADVYRYDPANPIPSRGGPICCTGNPEDQPGIFDQSEIEQRPDVLVYSTEELQNGLTLTGPIKGTVFISSSAKDTDFTLKLVDVAPSGKAYNIQEAILRTRYRKGFDTKLLMKTDNVYKLVISLHDTAYFLKPGHRLRLEVSSSNFPRFDRNLNTGGNNYDETHWVVATNKLHHNSHYVSNIELSVRLNTPNG